MPIQCECKCGKTSYVRDELAGKRARCPSCEGVFKIPSLRQSASVSARARLAQSQPVGSGAADEPASRRGLSLLLRNKKAIGAGVAVLVLALGWFLVVAPLLSSMDMSYGLGYVANGDLKKAIDHYQSIRAKVSGKDRERCDLWIKQLELELAKNAGTTLSQGKAVGCETVQIIPQKAKTTGGVVLAKLTLKNEGSKRLTLSDEHFYLRGLSDIVLVANHTDNSLDGVAVGAGKSAEGTVVFRKLPAHPASRKVGKRTEKTYYLIFNDGERYVKSILLF